MHRCRWLVAALLLSTQALAEPGWNYPGWQDTLATRAQAQALLLSFNRALLSGASATQTLLQWCGAHHLAAKAKISAERDTALQKPASAEIRRLLGASPDELIRYRRVKLTCGGHVLSEADNWYRPGQLTTEMNRVLDSSDIPFGQAVSALNFHRKTLSVEQLWDPLAERAPATATPTQLAIPPEVLRHQALLYSQDQQPFSLVVETYGREVFAFALAPASGESSP